MDANDPAKAWKRPSSLSVFISLMILFLLVIGVGGFVYNAWITSCQERVYSALQDIENIAHVKLPSSVEDATLYAVQRCSSPQIFYVRFGIDPGELTPFLASTRVTSVSSQDPIPSRFVRMQEKFGAVPFSLTGSSRTSGDYEQSIGVDTTNPRHYTVYMVVVSYD
jgi:hypothetical protein